MVEAEVIQEAQKAAYQRGVVAGLDAAIKALESFSGGSIIENLKADYLDELEKFDADNG